jgi:hypothetical protein
MPAPARLAVSNEGSNDAVRMRMAVNNSDDDIMRHRAMLAVDHALVELAANLIRVIRGTGRPRAVSLQAQALSDAMASYRSMVGMWPSAEEITASLRLDDPTAGWLDQASPMERNKWHAKQAIIRGSLQVTASSLLGQRVQRAAGHAQMYQGLAEIEEMRAQARAQWQGCDGETPYPKRKRQTRVTRRPAG